jgi:F-type H+-transporting ATPase subunit delta
VSSSKIARRYARALAELCDETGNHEVIGNQLNAFVKACEESADLAGVLVNPTVDNDAKQGIIQAVAQKGMFAPTTKNFFLVLLEHGRIGAVGEIAAAFQDLLDARAERLRAVVSTSIPLERADLDRIKKALERLTKQSVELDAKVEPGLIAGATVQIGNVVLDSSIRNQLEQLKDQLIN